MSETHLDPRQKPPDSARLLFKKLREEKFGTTASMEIDCAEPDNVLSGPGGLRRLAPTPQQIVNLAFHSFAGARGEQFTSPGHEAQAYELKSLPGPLYFLDCVRHKQSNRGRPTGFSFSPSPWGPDRAT